MKFLAITLLLLTSIFLIACSANQANKKISNSELENLAKQYGGVYIFDEKFEKEIEKREAERKELSKKMKGRDLGDGLYAIDPKPINEKLPRILSNGKRYYTRWIDYENQTGKEAKVPEVYINKIKEFIGDDFSKQRPELLMLYLYEDKDMAIPVTVRVSYTYVKTSYGLYGDEGRGFKLSKQNFVTRTSKDRFILTNNKFIKANKDK
ncbi:MAG: tRNA 2-selenouridine synthase [Campylobacter sp.]|uniref:tRNA 2-selenouridine synthase n=2 Tax=Campylobacter concisus TaxID=199 RepID=UPI000D30F767|nr:tRNA 2-selenouridine synthase [Campylobacter concisus]MDO4875281.1 tRNA 2-selenouridine synthase [Campylobacter sp.]